MVREQTRLSRRYTPAHRSEWLVEWVPTVVVKLAAHGAYFATDKEEGYVQAPKVEVVDTVAAGDAFGGVFTVALAEGRSLHEAVKWGVVADALAVTKQGAQSSMPTRDEVKALLSNKN